MIHARTLQQSNRERMAVCIIAGILILISCALFLAWPKAAAEANRPYAVTDLVPAYEKLANAMQNDLGNTMIANYSSVNGVVTGTAGQAGGTGAADIFARVFQRVALLAILIYAFINLMSETWKEATLTSVLRAFAVTMIAIILVTNFQSFVTMENHVVEYLMVRAADIPVENAKMQSRINSLRFFNKNGDDDGGATKNEDGDDIVITPQTKAAIRHMFNIQDDTKTVGTGGFMSFGYYQNTTTWDSVLKKIENACGKNSSKDLEDVPYSMVNKFASTAAQVTAMLDLPIIAGTFLMFVQVMEKILRGIFMPLALANVTMEGTRSPGFRYVKKYVGCDLKIFAYIIIGTLTSQMATTTLSMLQSNNMNIDFNMNLLGADVAGNAIPYLLVNLLGIYLMMQVASLIGELVE